MNIRKHTQELLHLSAEIVGRCRYSGVKLAKGTALEHVEALADSLDALVEAAQAARHFITCSDFCAFVADAARPCDCGAEEATEALRAALAKLEGSES